MQFVSVHVTPGPYQIPPWVQTLGGETERNREKQECLSINRSGSERSEVSTESEKAKEPVIIWQKTWRRGEDWGIRWGQSPNVWVSNVGVSRSKGKMGKWGLRADNSPRKLGFPYTGLRSSRWSTFQVDSLGSETMPWFWTLELEANSLVLSHSHPWIIHLSWVVVQKSHWKKSRVMSSIVFFFIPAMESLQRLLVFPYNKKGLIADSLLQLDCMLFEGWTHFFPLFCICHRIGHPKL